MNAAIGAVGNRATRVAIFVIELYRHTISPLRLPTCRFTPTCSQYAVDALTDYGLVRGGWLAMARLLKCGPWHRGGWDPVPVRGDGTRGQCVDDGSGRDVPARRWESESRV